MAWKIEFKPEAAKAISKLDPDSKKLIQSYLNDRILKTNNPKDLGKPLKNKMQGLWRYRVNKFRIICKIKDEALIISVIRVGHRSEVYE